MSSSKGVLVAPKHQSREVAALRRMARMWLATGIVPVAHIVEEYSGVDGHTAEHAIMLPPKMLARARRVRRLRSLRSAPSVP